MGSINGAGEYEFTPLTNGMDYLKSAIGFLQESSEPSALKYAVLHLHAAAEILLKVRLMREHWSLVFKDVGTASKSALTHGDFKSVGMEETISRLNSLASVEVSEPTREHLKRLSKERNKLQHFGAKMNRHQVGVIAGRALDTLLAFVVDHLIPGASEPELPMLGEVKDLLQQALDEIEVLGKARRDRLKGQLRAFADEVIGCPQCAEMAFRFNQQDFRCYFCEHVADSEAPEDLAADYVGNVLYISEYEVAHDGAEIPISDCPNCDSYASMVWGVTFLAEPQKQMYACFSCGKSYRHDEIDGCTMCADGLYFRTPIDQIEEEGEISLCSSCWGYVLSRD